MLSSIAHISIFTLHTFSRSCPTLLLVDHSCYALWIVSASLLALNLIFVRVDEGT